MIKSSCIIVKKGSNPHYELVTCLEHDKVYVLITYHHSYLGSGFTATSLIMRLMFSSCLNHDTNKLSGNTGFERNSL